MIQTDLGCHSENYPRIQFFVAILKLADSAVYCVLTRPPEEDEMLCNHIHLVIQMFKSTFVYHKFPGT